jgi:hypothetical protein
MVKRLDEGMSRHFESTAQIIPDRDAKLVTGLSETEECIAAIATNVAPGPCADFPPRDVTTDVILRTVGVENRKHSPNSARRRIFDGAAEAKLIALACSPPPKGRARWTLALLEDKVVDLNIVDRASDNTIGRTLKKSPQATPEGTMGHSTRRECRVRGRDGRCAGGLPPAP